MLQDQLEGTMGSSKLKRSRAFVEYCLYNGISYESMSQAIDTDIMSILPYILQLIQLNNIQKATIATE